MRGIVNRRPMKLCSIASLAAIFLLTLSAGGVEEIVPRAIPVEPDHGDSAISESGQFRVRGADPALRASVALLSEQSRAALLRLLAEATPATRLPIHILLVPGDPAAHPQNDMKTSITYSEQGFEIHLRIQTRRGLDLERFKTAITAALIYERSLQSLKPGESDARLFVPPWLVEGIREADRWQENLSDRRLYETLFLSGGLFSLDEMFTLDDAAFLALDAASRAAFQVSSGALVMALLEQRDGRTAFRKFLAEVASFAGEMPSLLRRHFPDLNLSENSMAKWWALQLAQKSAARLTESLSIFDTEAALVQSLKLDFRDDEGNLRTESIDAWPELLKLDPADCVAATRMAAGALVRLSYRCFPTYRPLLAAYQQVFIDIQQQKVRSEDIASRIEKLQEVRQNMIVQAERARDFMDWFEITRARDTSGAFDDYLRIKQQLKNDSGRSRTDSISSMLDRFDAIFYRDTGNRQAPLLGNW